MYTDEHYKKIKLYGPFIWMELICINMCTSLRGCCLLSKLLESIA